MALTVKLERSYRSKNGHKTFVYSVSGNKKELAEFETAQGEFHRVDEESGAPLWFTTRCIGETGKLLITTNGNVVPDMSAYDQAASIAEQYGGNFGAELAKAAAQKILGNKAHTQSESEDDIDA